MVDRQCCKSVSLNDNLAIFSTDLTLEESIFQREGALTAKVLVPILVLTSGATGLQLSKRTINVTLIITCSVTYTPYTKPMYCTKQK